MVQIRSANPADLPALQALHRQAFGGKAEAKLVALLIERGKSAVSLVAEVDGQVVGYVTTRLNRFKSIGQIPNLAVDPAYRNRGIASTLIQRALDYFREERMAFAKIETLAQNERGQSLYPKFGFVEVARQIHYVMPLTPES